VTTSTNAETVAGRRLEALSLFTPLGIRFWDFVEEAPVSNGLRVFSYLQNMEFPRVAAVRTRSGVYAFSGLPALRDVEYPPAAGGAMAASPPAALPFVITVEDTLQRFLPEAFVVELPLPERGLFPPESPGSPPQPKGRAYLFTAPTRCVMPGMAAIRADLWDRERDAPAGHAVLRVELEGRSGQWRGIADEQGRVLVLFPYPPIERLRLGSPPGAGQGSITEQTWRARVRVEYEPGKLSRPLAEQPGVSAAWASQPGLKGILEAQGAAILRPATSVTANEIPVDLKFGKECLLQTDGLSVLLISQGGSPP
jgi:hypothetical protein